MGEAGGRGVEAIMVGMKHLIIGHVFDFRVDKGSNNGVKRRRSARELKELGSDTSEKVQRGVADVLVLG